MLLYILRRVLQTKQEWNGRLNTQLQQRRYLTHIDIYI